MKLGKIQLHNPFNVGIREDDFLLCLITAIVCGGSIMGSILTVATFFGPIGVLIFLSVLLVPRVLYAVLVGK